MAGRHVSRARFAPRPLCRALIAAFLACAGAPISAQTAGPCHRVITADVVALDQAFFWNRLGALEPQGMIFALREDVVPSSGAELSPGNVRLRSGKRPRPMVLRMNVGDCLQVTFQNLLAPLPVDGEQPATRAASIHVIGMQLVNGIADDGSFVGENANSTVPPGGTVVYTFYAGREGTYMLYSTGATIGGQGDGGSLSAGLFGAVNVQPEGAEWYRSQVTYDDIQLGFAGKTPDGQPIIDYEAVYPPGHPRAGRPIFRMLDEAGAIRHTDLTAIITGPGRRDFPLGTYPENPVYPDRDQSFREFTIIYHDEPGALQAFEQFADPILGNTLQPVRDGFAINYGTGGIGAEILANRLGVGPMWDCTECKYEEFFLTSWAVGDPAMVVDVPANATPDPGPKATLAYYPDDPSNVYHSYMQDHVKFRLLHGGTHEHHIHHLHAHQWLHNPDSDNSTYLDSIGLGPGAGYTLEITHNGSGNRNQTVGDSIFHCHFYPHFAQGMWGLWRVHDVFEDGTRLGADGRPLPGARALPDAEITAGTPIPAVVAIPGRALAPLPQADVDIVEIPGRPGGQVQVTGSGNPGYPFFVPGMAGHRPPAPPLDTVDDGGLTRHIIRGGGAVSHETRFDFSKELVEADAKEIPEEGTDIEIAAMEFHEQRTHPSYVIGEDVDQSTGAITHVVEPADFVTNGLARVAGAPYADPCIDDDGLAVGAPRLYKGANIQIDAVLSKTGWHFPQQRIIALWGDVQPTLDGTRSPEPLFMRANTGDCVEYQHTNLVPNIYELDDFQVRTPTDVIGQHIHLVKFDVTSSDGSANGWNYEDGAFSPDEVRERMRAIRAYNNCVGDEISGGDPRDGTFACPIALPHPYFGAGPDDAWLGAQTKVQRWYVDDVLNLVGEDRTLRTVFTHDHYGPSTHQQVGLYAGLVVEPEDSSWRDPETGEIMGSRFDGGPTRFRADILTANPEDSYREFLLEYADFQLGYRPNPDFEFSTELGFADPAHAINAPGRDEVGLPDLQVSPFAAGSCPNGLEPPCPEAISADDPGFAVVNYRSEPIPLRIRNPGTNTQAAGVAGDLAHVFRSDVLRADPLMNVQPTAYPALTEDVQDGDPFTPILRAYRNDRIQIRTLVGAQEEGHNFSLRGLRWLFEPSDPNSGYRNSQFGGISEHSEFVAKTPPQDNEDLPVDYLYTAGSSIEDLWGGAWGLLRVYGEERGDLIPLPSNPEAEPPTFVNKKHFSGVCPRSAPRRSYDIVAGRAVDLLEEGTLVYNSRIGPMGEGPLHDPTALIYVFEDDIDEDTGKLRAGVPVEPIVLRANAGDCIKVEITNALPAEIPELDGYSTYPALIDHFNANQVRPSSNVGVHAQLVTLNPVESAGYNAGFNPIQTVAPGETGEVKWYAGVIDIQENGVRVATPVEFGAINLLPADPIEQSGKGLIGALVIEPEGSTWETDHDRLEADPSLPIRNSRLAASVRDATGEEFRELVLLLQNDLNLRLGDDSPVPLIAETEDPEDSGQKGINYRTEPMWFRMSYDPETPLSGVPGATRELDFEAATSNALVGGDPETPVFTAPAGTPVRLRVLQPGGHQRNTVFQVHGHVWQETPYVEDSTRIGDNPLSQWQGARPGHGPTSHFDAVLENGAGGVQGVSGDYLIRDMTSFHFDGGMWGVFRVTP